MPIVNMTWKEVEFKGQKDSGASEGFVFQVLGPSFVYPAHRPPVILSPHGCKNGLDADKIIVPVVAAITFERSSSTKLNFQFLKDQDHPKVNCALTSVADPSGRYVQLASGQYDPPEDARKDEKYEDAGEAKMAVVPFEMNEVKAHFLNLSFTFDEDNPFTYTGNFLIWINYWGYSNFCAIELRGAPDHALLVDMKYTRPPRV